MPTHEQLEHRRRLEEAREANAQRKRDTRRCILIGEYVVDHFPQVLRFKLRRTKAENRVEFEPLVRCLSALAVDPYVITLIEKSLSDICQRRIENAGKRRLNFAC